jgi:hypothetical protein
MSAVEALMSRMIDYAGLFPPASLAMETAVSNYQEYLSGEHSWMLGNIVVPARRLAEFTEAFQTICCGEQEHPWMVSVVGENENAGSDLKAIEDFQEGAAFLAAFEIKAADLLSSQNILGALPESRSRYVEFPPGGAEPFLAELPAIGARAKLRTGGITPDAIPSSESVASFLLACAAARVPFKATAGLHHAVRGTRRLTYDQGSPVATMHGFLNVFLAASLAYYGATEVALRATLDETDPEAFHLDGDLIAWHDHRLTSDQLERVRADFAVGFGSCSFTEPIDDLKAMAWL